MNSMKRQKEKTLKDELPRSVGAQHGAKWRNSSRKNEETKPKSKQRTAVDVTGDGNKVQCKGIEEYNEKLQFSSRKLEIPREHFMQSWTQ